MAEKIWRRDYWMGKARSKKNSPWLKVALVVAILWVWGHTSGMPDHSGAAPRPSASVSAHPTTGSAKAGNAKASNAKR